jgi:hypothetical protein
MRAGRLLGRERQHLRPQRGQHDRRIHRRARRHVEAPRHVLEVAAHGRDRLLVSVAAHAGDEMAVRHADALYEAAAGRFADREPERVHRHRIARVDVGDAGGEDEAARVLAEIGDQRERIAADRFGQPERRVAQASMRFVTAAASGAGIPSKKVQTPSRPSSDIATTSMRRGI